MTAHRGPSRHKTPTGVGGIQTSAAGTNTVLKFNATANQASTLWNAGAITGPFNVIYGSEFLNTTGSFTNGMSGPQQFYYITTQTNYVAAPIIEPSISHPN
jgi:imidazolonepropionase-like amidohydrolase